MSLPSPGPAGHPGVRGHTAGRYSQHSQDKARRTGPRRGSPVRPALLQQPLPPGHG
ncbi:hypothetical protein NHX12_004152, partial [Muraenolepis orangiensis]